MSGDLNLPAEVWEKILMHLSVGDLCRVVATSRHLYSMASQPWLWTGVTINRMNIVTCGLGELFSIDRFSKLKNIDLSHLSFTNQQLGQVLSELIDSNVENVNLTGVSLAEIDDNLLARAICGLDKIVLGHNDLSGDQCTAILFTCLNSTTLKEMKLQNTDLSSVPHDLLARAISRLVKITLEFTSLTTDHLEAVLTSCRASTSLEDISLRGLDLSNVPAQLISDAFGRLHKLELTCQAKRGFSYLNYLAGNAFPAYVTTPQVTSILTAILSSDTLKDVNLSYIDLSEVSTYLLSRAVSCLRRVNLSNSDLSLGQVTSILKSILASTTLEDVNLEAISLANIPVQLLARSLSRLRSLNLSQSCLTVDQCTAILTEAMEAGLLNRMEARRVEAFEAVDKDLLERAVGRFRLLV